MNKIFLNDEAEIEFGSCDSLADLASKIKEKINKDDVLLIYVNLKFKAGTRAEQKGIELLIWLRLKEVMNHCVLYSFETVHALLNRKPQYLIATSIGTSFYQLPINLDKIDVKEVKDKYAENGNLKNCLKSAFSISEFRHREANWWGVKALLDVHQVITNKMNENYPENLTDKLSELNNAVAQYVYGTSIDKIQNIVQKENQDWQTKIIQIEKETGELIEQLRKEHIEIELGETELIRLKEEIKAIEDLYIKTNQTDFILYRKELQREYEEWIAIMQPYILEYNSITLKKSNNEKQLVEANENRKNIYSNLKKQHETLLIDFYSVKPKVDIRNISIIYIDDNANNGWKYVLKKMLPKSKIKEIIPLKEHENNIEQLFIEQVKDEINNDTSIILLDLRLYDEGDRTISVEALSGKKLLEIIRKENPSIPIIIATASNKIWTHDLLMKLGADAYWIKEGLDEFRTVEESIKNYIKILSITESLTNDRYKLLKEFGIRIKQIAFEKDLWWENGVDWTIIGSERNMKIFKVPTITFPNKGIIISILNDSFILLREHLQRTEVKNNYNPFNEKEWVLPSIIIQHLGKIIELIHDFEFYENQYNRFRRCQNRGLIENFKYEPVEIEKYDNTITDLENKDGRVYIRNDKNGGKLFDKRNESSHTNNLSNIDFEHLQSFVIDICDYLYYPPDGYNYL